MARSLLESLVSGTRQVLTVQLIVAVASIALAGWTLGVTNELIRERDRLRERVIQLEEAMGASGVVVPETPATVDAPRPSVAETAYPAEIAAQDVAAADGAAAADGESAGEISQRDLGRLFNSLFSPPPPMRLVVLHVRSPEDGAAATEIASALRAQANVHVVVNMLQPRDPRAAGYTYFDGRQGRAAAALVTEFHDLARVADVAPWTSQLRGVALPAQGQFTADRVDLVLPALPSAVAPPPPVVSAPQR